MSRLQQSSSCTSADYTHSRFTNMKYTLNKISNIVINHQVNATFDPKRPKKKKNFTRFCTYCSKSDHTMKSCPSMKWKNLHEEKQPPQSKPILKITPTKKSCKIFTDWSRAVALLPKEVVSTVHTLQTAFEAELTVTLELSALKQDLTSLTRCMIHYNNSILQSNQISEPRKWGTKWDSLHI